MNPGDTVTYLLYLEDEAIPLQADMTLGNHLENDIVVPGEDVADFHVRIELTDRGPVIIPLANATVNVNGVEQDKPVQVIIGDMISIGQSTMQLGFEVEAASGGPETWAIHAADGGEAFEVRGEMSVGRAEGADMTLADAHISRFHARLVEREGRVWLQDLNSANGTRVNGQRIVGGVRLFHGDELSFDKLHFQLVGRGGDLTPVNQFEDPLRGTTRMPPQAHPEPTELVTRASGDSAEPAESGELPLPVNPDAGACLIGLEAPVLAQRFAVGVGDVVIGRTSDCDICLDDDSVSARHARVTRKPEGTVLTHLMSTNGVTVNGASVDSATLHDGDVIQLGRIRLRFQQAAAVSAPAQWPGWVRWAGGAVVVTTAVVAAWWLI